jgi:hypothetical protein
MFIAIVVPPCKKSGATTLCVLLAILLSCAFEYLPLLCAVPKGFSVIICAGVASALFAIISPREVPADE